MKHFKSHFLIRSSFHPWLLELCSNPVQTKRLWDPAAKQRDESSAWDQCKGSTSKFIYYLEVPWVHQSAAEHEGWILNLTIQVSQSWCVSPLILTLTDFSVLNPEWQQHVCDCVSVLEHCCLRVAFLCGHRLLLTCFCVFNCQTRFSHSQARLRPLPHPIET